MSSQSKMASRSSRPSQPPAAATRQNEYFVPRDGIDREVISADICRYLGNDALVRPGMYENPQTGQVVQGYYITAYRNLTTAMIEDLKADSARWDNERRAQTSRNTSGVHYHQSETHQSRQHHGPSEAPYQADPYARDPGYDAKRYPGTGAPGYTGASTNYQQPPPQAQQPGSYSGGGYGGYPQSQQSPNPDTRYTSPGGSMMPPPPTGYQEPYMATGANNMSRGYASNNGDPYASRSSAAPPQQPVYATSNPPPAGYSSAYSYGGQVPTSGAPGYTTTMHPQDPFMGRASPAGQAPSQQPQGFAAQQQQQQQHSTDRQRSSRR
jgi:hypothetical protein